MGIVRIGSFLRNYEKNSAGEIIAEHTISDYNKVLEKGELAVARDQFNLFISQAIRIRPVDYSSAPVNPRMKVWINSLLSSATY